MRSNSSPSLSASSPNSVVTNTRISGVTVVFDWGLRERGESTGLSSQADVVDVYGARLNEELEYENIRTHFLKDKKLVDDAPAGFLPVYVSSDWYTGRGKQHNASIVEFYGDGLYRLAERLCEALSDWGKAYVYGHKVSLPIAVASDKPFIRIKPFALNGPNADEYMKRLDKLGEDLGRAIGGYLAAKGEGIRR